LERVLDGAQSSVDYSRETISGAGSIGLGNSPVTPRSTAGARRARETLAALSRDCH
jgi:hypothetical protein